MEYPFVQFFRDDFDSYASLDNWETEDSTWSISDGDP